MAGTLIQRGKVWYLRYTGADGRRTMKRLATDKRVAEQLARKIEDEQDRIRGGWIDEKDLAYRDHEARPLADHVRDWHADLLAKGDTADHAELSRARVTRLIELARISRISALSPSKIQAALKAVRDAEMSQGMVSRFLRGERFLSPEAIDKVLEVLGLEIAIQPRRERKDG